LLFFSGPSEISRCLAPPDKLVVFDKNSDEEEQPEYHDKRIGEIKRRPAGKTQKSVKINADKINHPFRAKDPVDKIADTAAEYTRYGPALEGGKFVGFKIINHKKNQYRRGNKNKQKRPEYVRKVVPKAEGNGRIPHMVNFKKLVSKDIFDKSTASRPIFDYKKFGNLIYPNSQSGQQKRKHFRPKLYHQNSYL
jgi:hypothetical protein